MPKRTLLFLLLSGGLAVAAQAQTTPATDVTPAAAPTTLRGQTSLSFADSPLLVVDGVPILDKQLSDLNPADIESITVLKNVGMGYCRPQRNVLVITTKNARRARHKVTPAKLLIRPDEISLQPIGQ